MQSKSGAVSQHGIEQVCRVLDSAEAIGERLIASLRSSYPAVRFTLCSEDDMGAREPYQTGKGYDLHLVAANQGGCSHLTFDLSECSGLVIALHEE
jgi:hypothetical protein